MRGQAAYELTPQRVSPSNKIDFVKLWLSARTYLPLAEQFTDPWGTRPSEEDFQMLPPTPANLAQLKVRVPAGFRWDPPESLVHIQEPMPN